MPATYVVTRKEDKVQVTVHREFRVGLQDIVMWSPHTGRPGSPSLNLLQFTLAHQFWQKHTKRRLLPCGHWGSASRLLVFCVSCSPLPGCVNGRRYHAYTNDVCIHCGLQVRKTTSKEQTVLAYCVPGGTWVKR